MHRRVEIFTMWNRFNFGQRGRPPSNILPFICPDKTSSFIMNVQAVMEELRLAKEALALAQQSRDQALKNLKEVSEAQEEKDSTALKPRFAISSAMSVLSTFSKVILN